MPFSGSATKTAAGRGEQPHAALHDGVKHGLQVVSELLMTSSTSRCRGLLLQRLSEIVGALAQLVQQPRVLDRDHRLVGEGLNQLDLGVREWPDLAVDSKPSARVVALNMASPSRVRISPIDGPRRLGDRSSR